MPKRTVYAYTVLLYIYMKQSVPIPGPVFLYMYLYYLVNTPPVYCLAVTSLPICMMAVKLVVK